jgi:hypothetical protein
MVAAADEEIFRNRLREMKNGFGFIICRKLLEEYMAWREIQSRAPKNGVARVEKGNESGMGLPHSKTLSRDSSVPLHPQGCGVRLSSVALAGGNS